MPPAARAATEWTQEKQSRQKVEVGAMPGTIRARPVASWANHFRMIRLFDRSAGSHKLCRRACQRPTSKYAGEVTTGLGGNSEPQTYKIVTHQTQKCFRDSSTVE